MAIDPHPSIPPLHPGELLSEEILPKLGMTKVAVAEKLGVTRQMLGHILSGKSPVTAPVAYRLGELVGNGGRFWLALQADYDLWHLARRAREEKPLRMRSWRRSKAKKPEDAPQRKEVA